MEKIGNDHRQEIWKCLVVLPQCLGIDLWDCTVESPPCSVQDFLPLIQFLLVKLGNI